MNKRGFEFSFGWIFALIAGAAILALAIYGTTSFIQSGERIEDSARAVEISALLRELETGLEQQGTSEIDLGGETRIINNCSVSGSTLSEKSFGVQSIRTAIASGIGNKFNDNGVPLQSSGIYLFSDGVIEGERLQTFSQSFEFPFKVADIVAIWPSEQRYCFIGAPAGIRENAEGLHIPGLNFTTSIANCLPSSKKVCFSQRGCDVDVSTQLKAVSRGGKTSYYDEEGSALFYGAIFSDSTVYECQVQRMMHRAAVLAKIYADKASISNNFGCPALNLVGMMTSYAAQLEGTRSSSQISTLYQTSNSIEEANNALACPQF